MVQSPINFSVLSIYPKYYLYNSTNQSILMCSEDYQYVLLPPHSRGPIQVVNHSHMNYFVTILTVPLHEMTALPPFLEKNKFDFSNLFSLSENQNSVLRIYAKDGSPDLISFILLSSVYMSFLYSSTCCPAEFYPCSSELWILI